MEATGIEGMGELGRWGRCHLILPGKVEKTLQRRIQVWGKDLRVPGLYSALVSLQAASSLWCGPWTGGRD